METKSFILFPKTIRVNGQALQPLQTLLNIAYSKTYCSIPEIFGTSHSRLNKPDDILETLGELGFLILLLTRNDATEPYHLVATGSVKKFDRRVDVFAQTSEDGIWKPKDLQHDKLFYELTAFAVSPDAQARGLGVKILHDIEWLLSSSDNTGSRLEAARSILPLNRVSIRDGEEVTTLAGIDVQQVRKWSATSGDYINASLSHAKPDIDRSKLTLMVVRELGTEAYYQRRGFKSIWSGKIAPNTWKNHAECTGVYMEKQLDN